MYKPTDVCGFQIAEQRALLLKKIAHDKGPDENSCFFHANSSLWRVLTSFKERKRSYSNFLVRFPEVLEDVEIIDFEDAAEQHKWFGERLDDSDLLKELSRACRADVKN